MNRLTCYIGAASLILPFFATNASASVMLNDPILVPEEQQVRQSASEPCVIGESSCANDSPIDYTLIPQGNEPTFDLLSPLYTYDALTAAVSDTFRIAFDINKSGNGLETLDYVSVLFNGEIAYEYTDPNAPIDLGAFVGIENGTGISDFAFPEIIDISGLSGEDTIQFRVAMSNLTNGGEQIFLVPTERGNPVPEPSTISLLGLGLIALSRLGKSRSA